MGQPITIPDRPAVSKPSILVLAAMGSSFSISFQVLLPVAPVLAERRGPHGAAGAATAALFVGAVVGEFLTPWAMSWWSHAWLLVAGQLLTAIASVAYLAPGLSAWQLVAATGGRGFGMGVGLVVAVALIADLGVPNRRGRAMGYFGLALGAPGIVLPSVGVWLLASGHGELAALVAVLAGLSGALFAWRLRHSLTLSVPPATNVLAALRTPRLLALFAGFVLVSCSFGGVVTYAPIALPLDGLGSAAMFLFVSGISRMGSRWLAGVLGDHQPAQLILLSGVALSLLGVMALATRNGPVMIVVAAAGYGVGYGAVQTGAYLAMTERGSSTDWGAISALWNSGTDLGASMGGALLGFSAALYGYANGVWIIPAVLLTSLPLFWWSPRSRALT